MGKKKIEIEEKWHHPPTFVYEDNYGYLANYYQPMLDYIDKRDRREVRSGEYPHIPWTNERGLNKYRPSNKIQKYATAELNALAVEAEEAAKRNLKDVRVGIKSSDFAKIKSVQASRLSEHLRLASVDKEVKKALVDRRHRRSQPEEEMADYELSLPVSKLTQRPKILHNVSKIKSVSSIKNQLLFEANRNLNRDNVDVNLANYINRQHFYADEAIKYHDTVTGKRLGFTSQNYLADKDVQYVRPTQSQSIHALQTDLRDLENKTTPQYPVTTVNTQLNNVHLFDENRKQTSIEIEQLNARVVEAETKLKTEVTRIKKKLQVTITDLELSLDVANKNNLELQKTVKKQSLQLTELQAHYDEIQRQLAVTLDQLAVTTRKNQSLTAELEEIRGNYDNALRSKRNAEQMYEESQVRVNEMTTINVNLSAARAKLEQELQSIANDYEEVTKELRIADERFQRTQVELKHTVEHLHEEQERIVKIETIKKSLEIEVKNLSVRLEEVEANAIVGGKRIISKLEARIRDIEIELEEEKRRHAETVKILRKKERTLKEIVIQSEEDHKNVQLLQEGYDKAVQKLNLYKRQLQEQEGMSQQSVTRVRRFQRELEAAEDRADTAESNLSLIRAKHRTFVTTNTVPGSQVYLVQETRTSNTTEY